MSQQAAQAGKSKGGAAQRSWWKMLLGALALAGLVFLLVQGAADPKPVVEPKKEQGVIIPLPKTPHVDVQEEARGMYVLETEKMSFHLELLPENRFRFLSRREGQELREAFGSWNLVGNRLTMSYKEIDGQPVKATVVARNIYRGSSIELRDTGVKVPVILQKRTMIRQR